MNENVKGINLVWLSKTGLTNLNAGEGEANLVDIKKYKKNGKEYPYVSGQAMRYYIKEAIRRNLEDGEFMCIPDERGEPTCKGNIEKCINCDLFGFMATIKKGIVLPRYPEGHPGGAHTRTSPLKVSPAMGLLPAEETIVMDFLTRRKPQEIAARSQPMSNHSVSLPNGPKKMKHRAERKSMKNNALNAFHASIPKNVPRLLLSII